jgi:hypothetical protein
LPWRARLIRRPQRPYRLDGTTADQAAKHAQAAGYSSVSGLKKSCDNNWHGQAMLNGAPVNVMITPDGRVVQEGS